jgi:hypothetical protein
MVSGIYFCDSARAVLISAKSKEKGLDETLREIEATGLGRLSSFPSVNLIFLVVPSNTSVISFDS